MSFWDNPIQSISDTVSHVGDVISSDPAAQGAVLVAAAAMSGGASLAADATVAADAGTSAAMAGGFGSGVAADAGTSAALSGGFGTGVAADAGTTAAMSGGFSPVTASSGFSLSSITTPLNTALDSAVKLNGALSTVKLLTGKNVNPSFGVNSVIPNYGLPVIGAANTTPQAGGSGATGSSGAAAGGGKSGIDLQTIAAIAAIIGVAYQLKLFK